MSDDVTTALEVLAPAAPAFATPKEKLMHTWRQIVELRKAKGTRVEVSLALDITRGMLDDFERKYAKRLRGGMTPSDAILDMGRWVGDDAKPRRVTRPNMNYAESLPEDVRAQYELFIGELIADLGGHDNLTAMQKMYVAELGKLLCMSLTTHINLARKGLKTPRGRVRGEAEYALKLADRIDRYAQRLGMARVTRNATTSMADYLKAQTAKTDAA